MQPLAEQIRPTCLEEVVGQQHLLAPNRPLRRIIESGKIPNMIFYGPSGVGKTTVARMIANSTSMSLHKLNGTTASTADLREVAAEVGTLSGMHGILLYLDEIQYLNKKQQQSLLEYIESGDITLIASTTENPYFAVYNASTPDGSPGRGSMFSRTNRSKRAIPCSRSVNRTACCSRPTTPGRPSRRSKYSWSASHGTSGISILLKTNSRCPSPNPTSRS